MEECLFSKERAWREILFILRRNDEKYALKLLIRAINLESVMREKERAVTLGEGDILGEPTITKTDAEPGFLAISTAPPCSNGFMGLSNTCTYITIRGRREHDGN